MGIRLSKSKTNKCGSVGECFLIVDLLELNKISNAAKL